MASVTYSWDFVSSTIFVNDVYTAGAQINPAIAAINDGSSYFSVWDDVGALEGRIIDTSLTPSSSEFLINSTIANEQTDASVVQLANGNVVVSFTDYSADSTGDIRARLFTASGTPLANDFIAADGWPDTDSDVAALADGGFVISWTRDFGSGDTDIRAQVYNSDGTERGGFVTVGPTSDSESASQVVGLENGNFVVAYQSAPAAGGNESTYFQIFDATGTALGGAQQFDPYGSINEDIQIVSLQDGGLAVAYTDNGWDYDGTEITVRIFNADGSTRSGFLAANTDVTGNQVNPTLTVLSNGYIVVGWTSGSSLVFQAYTPDGERIGENYGAVGSTVEAEIAGLTGGLLANVRESTVADSGGDNSIRTDIVELTRTTTGDSFSETLTGDSLRDTILGAGGDDTLYGLGGNDWLNGGTGADTMVGGYGDDTFIVDNSGDVVTETSSVGGHDTVRSSISYALVGWTEDLILTGTAAINGTGNSRVNFIQGNNAANTLNGGAGADEMRGAGGNDVYIVDNAGDRAIETASASGDDTVKASVSYIIGSGIERLTLTGSAAINGTGNASDNVLTGNNGDNILAGRAGQDSIAGNGGIDRLYGEGGNDILDGGAGGDAVEGGAGQDRLTGGLGADYFVFRDGDFGTTTATADRVTDFSHAEGDRLRLNYADANSSVGGDQAFTFIGTATFTHVAGQLRYEQISGNTYVAGDTNGDGTADFVIRLDGLHTLVSGDFVL